MLRIRFFACILVASVVAVLPANAAQDTQLRAVRGTVGYQLTKDAPFSRVIGSLSLSDDRFAVTRAASNGLLVLADSSSVGLGQNTTIEVGAITQADAAAPTAMSLTAGTIRFDIRHPAGGRSNYRFDTPTSQIAVRGTIGLVSSGPDGDTITCLDCAPGDVTVTPKKRAAFVLLTGQTAVVSPAGDVVVSTTTAALVGIFSIAGLSTIAAAPSPFTPESNSNHAANYTVPIAAGAIAGAAIGITSSGSSPTPATPSPIVIPTLPPVPVVSPTPVASPTGGLTINSHTRSPQSIPAAPVAAPQTLPGAARPGMPGGRP